MTAKVYRSFRELKTTLGQLDAAHELSELALRLLAEAAGAEGAFEEFVSAAAARHGLHVRVQNPSLAQRMLALSAITTVHGTYEAFIADFVAEATILVGLATDLGKKADGQSKHQYLIASLAQQSYKIRAPEFGLLEDVLEHFRLVRNAHAHRSSDKLHRIEQLRIRIVGSSHWDATFCNQPPPSPFQNVGFTDFLLFTNAVRLVARVLAEALRPSDQAILAHPDVIAFQARDRNPSQGLPLFLKDRFALDEPSIKRILS